MRKIFAFTKECASIHTIMQRVIERQKGAGSKDNSSALTMEAIFSMGVNGLLAFYGTLMSEEELTEIMNSAQRAQEHIDAGEALMVEEIIEQ